MRRFIATELSILRAIVILSVITIVTGIVVRNRLADPSNGSGVSKSRRVDLVAYHPQLPNPTAAEVPPAAAAEPIGPVPPVDPSQPKKPAPKRSGMDTPKLVNPFDAPRETVVSNLVGDRACAECHPGEHALHFGSGHARTLRPAGQHPVARKLANKIFRDEENTDVLWRYIAAGERLEAEQIQQGKATCVALDWAVGSGEHGVTFMSIIYDPAIEQYKGIEHRLSHLAHGDEMTITPGQAKRDVAGTSIDMTSIGRTLDRKGLVKCLECHSTVTSDKKPGEFDPHTIIPNVSCERCHGPGRQHIEDARQGLPEDRLSMPLGPSTATPFRQIHECGTCHRRINLLPPSQLHPDNFELARFQPVGLEASACFQEGKSGLKCTTCHDPHAKVSRDRTPYVNACVNCHKDPGQSLCKVEPKGDCITCHMPKRVVSEVFEFTDHWIRVPK